MGNKTVPKYAVRNGKKVRKIMLVVLVAGTMLIILCRQFLTRTDMQALTDHPAQILK